MLRIFRGQRRVEDAAQPGQREQDSDAEAERDTVIERTAPAGRDTLVESTAPAGRDTLVESTTPAAPQEAPASEPGFLDRGRIRRRARFLRAARELAYRDLGGLVFDLHRFGQRNDEVVKAKLDTLARIDAELRVLEATLRERRPVTVLREAGVAACPRCAAIHGSGDRFCPTCGLSVDQAERPIATPNAAPPPAPMPGAPPPIPEPSPPAPAIAPPQAPPEAPAPASASPQQPEQATEVIRAAPVHGGHPSQRTAAFDPLSRPGAAPPAEQEIQQQEPRRP